MISALLFASMLLQQPITTVDSEVFDLGPTISVEWNCERDNGSDKLSLMRFPGTEGGSVLLFARQLKGQEPELVVNCSAEIYTMAEDRLTMSSGWCPNEWAADIRLNPNDSDQATVDLRLGDEHLDNYQCTKRYRVEDAG